jgi:hypothetical protein
MTAKVIPHPSRDRHRTQMTTEVIPYPTFLTQEFVDSVKIYEARKGYTFGGVRTIYVFHFKKWWKPALKIKMEWDWISSKGDSERYRQSDQIIAFEKALRKFFGY